MSDELSHFVGKGKSADEQFDVLLNILDSGWLTHPPHNPNITGNLEVSSNKSFASNEMYNPQMVCFCDIPEDQLAIHCVKYSRFGLSFQKRFVSERGGRPVLYVPSDGKIRTLRCTADISLNHLSSMEELHVEETLAAFFNRLAPALSDQVTGSRKTIGVSPLMSFVDFQILSYIKFYDLHLEDTDERNFYLEREWRILGNLPFRLKDVRRVFLPPDYVRRFRERFPSLDHVDL